MYFFLVKKVDAQNEYHSTNELKFKVELASYFVLMYFFLMKKG
ncbi:hypothetical protein RU95_GL003009 [Enterococcus avium]|nr:hypothetical protein RU95_GL003009 [Enterococcus avium]